VGGMKDKLEEATAKLDRLKAKHARRDDELGEITAHASHLVGAGLLQCLDGAINVACCTCCAVMQQPFGRCGGHMSPPVRRSLTLRHGR